ncbi:MAG: hypothetical protein U0T73_02465 [Chitinophagales bacterium]
MAKNFFSQHPTFYKYDKLWIGVLLGLIVPSLGIFLVYGYGLVQHYAMGAPLITLSMLWHSAASISRISSFLSVGCMLNLGVFYLFINRDYFNVAKGVILATMLLAIPVVIGLVRNDAFR